MPNPNPTDQTTYLLQQWRQGDRRARDRLLDHADKKLRQRARQMLHGFPRVRRWTETSDVMQDALFRLHRALDHVPLDSPRHFWNLAALQIRRVLHDLADRYRGPAGSVVTEDAPSAPASDRLAEQPDRGGEPSSLAEWAEFHHAIQGLPGEEREVFGMIWYLGLSQPEAAELLRVSLRTVRRRWLSARLLLCRGMDGNCPN